MKASVVLLVLAMAAAAVAQQGQAPQVSATTNIVTRQQTPTYSDVYCAGFVTGQPLQKSGFVAGGWGNPHQVRFTDREYVYLQGSGFAVGSEYLIVRQEKDPNHYESFRGQFAAMHQLGRAYADIGRVRVLALHNNIAITQVEFNCKDMMQGDAVVPYVERPIPTLRSKVSFDPFATPNGKLTGKIAMAKDFDTLLGMGQKVYLNVGSNQGVKVGDYFRVTRNYESYKYDEADNISFKATYYDDMQVPAGMFPYSRLGELPRISLGEMVVLNVTPTSSTGMITLSVDEIHLGDGVELEEGHAETGEAEPAATPTETSSRVVLPPPAPAAPVISCSAEPATVHAGDTSTISCEASSSDHSPLTFSFSASNGRLVQRENTAVLDTRDVAAGPVQVLATASDDRDQVATARTTVTVDSPRAALAPAKLNYVSFKHNSARVDNAGKAVLDGVALRLERETESSLVVLGLVEAGENRELAQQRAANAAEYLSKEKGIDKKRLQLQHGGEYGEKAELWMVPPGAKLQQADLQH